MKGFLFALFLIASNISLAAEDNVSRERLERHLRTLRIVELSSFDERRRPYQEQQIQYSRILKKAAEGDSSAVAQVDEAIARIFDLRVQLTQIDKDMLNALSKELTAQQRAKLALVFGSLRDQMRQEIQKMRPAEGRKSPEK